MTAPIWKLVKDPYTHQEVSVWREWDDGEQESCLITAPEYLRWLEAGNIPTPAEENQ
jgi:hypothetical protein